MNKQANEPVEVQTMTAVTGPAGEIIEAIIAEYNRAVAKHPTWPDDEIHCAAIVVEEAGELIRAAINRKYEPTDTDDDNTFREALHVAATAFRFLLSFEGVAAMAGEASEAQAPTATPAPASPVKPFPSDSDDYIAAVREEYGYLTGKDAGTITVSERRAIVDAYSATQDPNEAAYTLRDMRVGKAITGSVRDIMRDKYFDAVRTHYSNANGGVPFIGDWTTEEIGIIQKGWESNENCVNLAYQIYAERRAKGEVQTTGPAADAAVIEVCRKYESIASKMKRKPREFYPITHEERETICMRINAGIPAAHVASDIISNRNGSAPLPAYA